MGGVVAAGTYVPQCICGGSCLPPCLRQGLSCLCRSRTVWLTGELPASASHLPTGPPGLQMHVFLHGFRGSQFIASGWLTLILPTPPTSFNSVTKRKLLVWLYKCHWLPIPHILLYLNVLYCAIIFPDVKNVLVWSLWETFLKLKVQLSAMALCDYYLLIDVLLIYYLFIYFCTSFHYW